MLESQYQSKVIKKYELLGYYVIKLIKTNKNGIPDLICIKNNDVLFVEVKVGNNKPSKIQEFRLNELNNLGIKAIVDNG